MDLIYLHRFTKNADGTNRLVARYEKCLLPTNDYFWKDPVDIKNKSGKTRETTKKSH